MSVSRREFLQTCGAVTLGFSGLYGLAACSQSSFPSGQAVADAFGPLLSDANGILDLPEGFSYRIVSQVGDKMADGLLVPGDPDGMATFAGPNGLTILVRNHELSTNERSKGPFGGDNSLFDQVDRSLMFDTGYDETPSLGGTTTILYDTKTQSNQSEWLSLGGTVRNCAGGPTPWNSWITCEETVLRQDAEHSLDHGFNFDVPASAMLQLTQAEPIRDMGRFNHEAVAVDEASGIVYQTEDRDDGLLYRFIPNTPGKLVEGGKLQALAVVGQPSLDTRNWGEGPEIERGANMVVGWIDIENVLAPDDDLRHQGFANGAARFARGEGMWAGEDGIYFACTSGGRAHAGQIWKYIPSPDEGTPAEQQSPGILELFVEPNDKGLIDNADNLTVAPWGDLVVCEDGSGEQFVVGVTPEGGIYKFARNARSSSEFAGACFSPDGSTLFVNIQGDGLTLAITGPWSARRA